MRDSSIEGSYDCWEWYKIDPKYTENFLRENALVTGAKGQPTNTACSCAGCSGKKAIDFCPQDVPYSASDEQVNYMDIETAKTTGKIGKMRLTINDDMLDPDKCSKNELCSKHTCLEVHTNFGHVWDVLALVAEKEYRKLDLIRSLVCFGN